MTIRTTLTLYQLTWKAKDYDPDGAPYATEAEAETAKAAAARNVLRGYTGPDVAEAIESSTDADDYTAERLDAIRALGEFGDDEDAAALTDEEAVLGAAMLYDFESGVYAVTVEVDALALLQAVRGSLGISAGAYLEAGAVLAAQAYERWESGDLAGAVNALGEWSDEVKEALPFLDYTNDDEEEEAEAEEEDAAMRERGFTPESFAATVAEIEGKG